jgi:hypothetical protein
LTTLPEAKEQKKHVLETSWNKTLPLVVPIRKVRFPNHALLLKTADDLLIDYSLNLQVLFLFSLSSFKSPKEHFPLIGLYLKKSVLGLRLGLVTRERVKELGLGLHLGLELGLCLGL